MIDTGKWMQKVVWNRMVTTMIRDHPHKQPVTSTWTVDFLTKEGEGLKAMGDWLKDKSTSWKAHRRLLQTNAGVFPCEARLQRWGKTDRKNEKRTRILRCVRVQPNSDFTGENPHLTVRSVL